MLVDSHAHLDRLDLQKYHGKLENALLAAKQNDVGHILSACIHLENFPEILNIATQYENVTCSVGVHPSEQDCRKPTVREIAQLAEHKKVVGIGETGLDYSYAESDFKLQQDYFRIHIQAAKEIKKPLIIHSRQAPEHTLKIIQEEKADEVSGVMHCFTESWDLAQAALDLGFYISLSGIITFKNAHALREVAKKIPLNRLLIETDAPFIAPEPYRGKSNEPAYVRLVAEKLAELRKISYDEVAEATTENFWRLFHL